MIRVMFPGTLVLERQGAGMWLRVYEWVQSRATDSLTGDVGIMIGGLCCGGRPSDAVCFKRRICF